jgi:L-ascorbate metabolism protein UlaG (beta-lactamase superfamily)
MGFAVLALLGVLTAGSPVLEARFIGNAAFEITDGTSTILVDFPYRSGAFGYMAFPSAEVHLRPGALCLFTHHHADHFDPAAVAVVGCTVAGPDEVRLAAPERSRAGPGPWRHGAARIECLPTPHASVEHCSYRVSWHGVEVFLSGDIEDLEPLRRSPQRFDVLFLASWLLPALDGVDPAAASARVVVHHHGPEEEVSPCDRCLVPEQGATFTLRPASPDRATD